MQLRPLALAAMVAMCVGAKASAQSAPSSAPTKRDLGFGALVNVVYESNPSRSGKAIAIQRGVRGQDVSITPTVNLRLTQPIGQQAIFLSGSAGYQFFRRNDSLNRATYAANASTARQFGSCALSASATYRASRAEIDDLDPLTSNNRRSTYGPTVGLQCGRPSGLGANFAVSKLQNKNSEARLRTSDSDIQSITFGVGYQNPSLGQYGLTYGYTSNEFPNRNMLGRPVGDGFFTETVGLTGQRDFGRLTVNVAASKFLLKREFAPPGEKLKLRGTTYASNLSYDLGTRISLNVGASRSIRPSNRPGKLYDLAETANVGVGYKLGSRFQINLSHSYGEITSNGDTAPLLTAITKSRLNSTSASIDFSQNSVLSYGLNARYEKRDTNLPQFDYTDTIIGFRAGASF